MSRSVIHRSIASLGVGKDLSCAMDLSPTQTTAHPGLKAAGSCLGGRQGRQPDLLRVAQVRGTTRWIQSDLGLRGEWTAGAQP